MGFGIQQGKPGRCLGQVGLFVEFIQGLLGGLQFQFSGSQASLDLGYRTQGKQALIFRNRPAFIHGNLVHAAGTRQAEVSILCGYDHAGGTDERVVDYYHRGFFDGFIVGQHTTAHQGNQQDGSRKDKV